MSVHPLLLALACTCLPGTVALARETSASAAQDTACAREKFSGKDAKARRQACLEDLRREALARERRERAEVERLRLELRERCAQDPHGCEARQAELELKLQDRGRERHAEGYAKD